MPHIDSPLRRIGRFPSALIIALAFGLIGAHNPSSNLAIVTAQRPSRIVFDSNRDGNFEISLMNADGTGAARLTDHPANDSQPTLSPDGSRITFASNREGNFQIYVMAVEGTNVTRLSNNRAAERSPSFSPDGTKIAFESDRDGSSSIYIMNADGTGVTRLTR